ncbi:KIFC1 family protein [Megaselia abdita]
MDSKLPKPGFQSSLKRPGFSANPVKTILPSDRIGLKIPLTTNLLNIPERPKFRAASPEPNPKPLINRTKLRRSKSVSDLRSDLKSFNLKRNGPTFAPIPAKTARVASKPLMSSKSVDNFKKPATSSISRTASVPVIKRNAVTKTAPTKSNATKSATATASASSDEPKAPVKKKFAPYDFKGKYQDLLERHKELKEKLQKNQEAMGQLETLPDLYDESQTQLFATQEDLKNSKVEVECLQRECKSQEVKISSITKCLQKTKDELDSLLETYKQLNAEHELVVKEASELRERSANLFEENSSMKIELEECKDQLFQANIDRKDLHNQILDLRGNIRVFCRIRPPLQSELDRNLCGWNYLDEASLEVNNFESLDGKQKANHKFSFDYVFHPKSRQEDVFEMVSPLIQSALDGYNICIFAYGQTGSGKTFTMDGISEDAGVIPRTVDLLFESVKNYKRMGWEYKIKASFLEIYNEVLYDLLSNDQKEMEIRMGKNKTDIYVTNITDVVVETASNLRHLMHVAKQNRATASTVGNERSSRSHAVTKIELIGTHKEKGEISIGSINLVDLAGSESPKTSTRMNETKSINRSLSELTNVILALLQKQDYIPYRNSKLTHLLMPSLGGNSKTLMFINVAPFLDCFVESVKSLRFAASVNSCKLAKAKKNKVLNMNNSDW